MPGSRKSVTLGEQEKSDGGARQVFDDGMHGSSCRVKQGDLSGKRLVFMRIAPMSRPDGGHSVHSGEEAGKACGAEGAQEGGCVMTVQSEWRPVPARDQAHQPPLAILMGQFSSLVVWVLIGAGIISALLGEWVDGPVKSP